MNVRACDESSILPVSDGRSAPRVTIVAAIWRADASNQSGALSLSGCKDN